MLHCRHTELFDFQNTMRNSTISKQLRLEEQNIQSSKRETEINQDRDQGNLFSSILENKEINNQTSNLDINVSIGQKDNTSVNPSFSQLNNQTSDTFISFISSRADFSSNCEE